MNGQPLRMVHGVLPRLSPRIRTISRSMSLTVPAQSVFFLVIPDSKAPACLINTGERVQNPMKTEDVPRLVTNNPLPTPKIPSLPWKLGMKPGDIFIEKGGIFTDVNVNKNVLVTSPRSEAKEDILEKIEAQANDTEKYFETKPKKIEEPTNTDEDSKVSNLSGMNVKPNEHYVTYNKENNPLKPSSTIASENSKKYRGLKLFDTGADNNKFSVGNSNESEILNHNNETYKAFNGSNSISNNDSTKINLTQETRVKRSEDYDYFEHTEIRDTETSPLYRKVNLLRRILNKMQQSNQYEDEDQDQYYRDFAKTVHSSHGKNEINSLKLSEKSSDYPAEIPYRKENSIEKEKIPRTVQNKEVETINYLPGEFYEILGGLKIDSNVSLKDKEEILRTTESNQNQPESSKCNVNESKLTVTKKPESDLKEDSRLIEHATETLRQHYTLNNHSSEIKINTRKPEDIEGKNYNRKDELPQKISKEDNSKNDKQAKPYPMEYFQGLKKVESDYESIESKLSPRRIKREKSHMEEVGEGLDKTVKLRLQNEQTGDNYYNPDDSDEVELKRYLQELTSEGEQLLQTIDEEYESNIGNSSYESDSKQLLRAPEHVSIMDKNKNLVDDGNKTGETDFYLKHNIVVDKEVKPKIEYQPINEKGVEYAFLDTTTSTLPTNIKDIKNQFSSKIDPDIDSNMSETDHPSSKEPSVLSELTTLRNSNEKYIKTNSSTKSMTESLNNSDMFIESIIPKTDKTTKPGINIEYNSNLQTPSNILYNHTDNGDIGYNMSKSSKVSETNEEVLQSSTNMGSKSLIGNKTDQNEMKPSGKSKSILISKISDFISSMEENSGKENPLEIKHTDVGSILTYPTKTINKNMNKSLVTKEVLDNNYEVTNSDQPQIKPVTMSKPMFTVNISDISGGIIERNADKKRKIDSESKVVNEILPPPPKLTLTLRPFSLPPVSVLNRTINLPNTIDIINKKIAEFTRKHKISAPILGRSFSTNSTLTDKYKERLEAIKQRLQKARERLLNLTTPRTTPIVVTPTNIIKVKRGVDINKGILNSLFNIKKESQTETQSEKTHIVSAANQDSFIQLEGSLTEYPSISNLSLIHRLARQIYDENQKESSSIESNPDQSGSEETKGAEGQLSSNNLTPYYFSAIKKWVVPLSNSTNNILLNNKLFPVNLYGIVSDKWVQENMKNVSSKLEPERRRRALRYPCVKDKFNDFEAEDDSSKFQKNIEFSKPPLFKSAKAHPLTAPGNTIPIMFMAQLHSNRPKRATNQDIEMNEMEMKALLTNEIVKEKPAHDVSEDENIFSSMLHKTLTKTVTNKTGIDRMLELAKQYQKTNPSSLEIISIKNKQHKKKKYSKETFDESEEENTASEVTDNINLDNNPTTKLRIEQISRSNTTTRNNLLEGAVKSLKENPSTEHEQSSHSLSSAMKSHDVWSEFIDDVQEFFESVSSAIKKGIM